MRLMAMFAALALATAPIVMAAQPAYADGVERPRPRPRPRVRPAPPAHTPAPPAPRRGPEEVTLSQSFFAGSSGGVGADVGGDVIFGGGGTIILRSGAQAFAFASASARATSGARGHFGGRRHGCGCR